MFYGQEAMGAKEISYLTYDCNKTYHKVVENHVIIMIKMHKHVLTQYIKYAAKLKEKFV